MPAKGQVAPKVMQFFEQNPDRSVYLAELKALFGGDVLNASIQAAVGRLIAKDRWPIQVVKRGQVWMYSPVTHKQAPPKEAWTEPNVAEVTADRVAKSFMGSYDADKLAIVTKGLNIARGVMGNDAFIRRVAEVFIEHKIDL